MCAHCLALYLIFCVSYKLPYVAALFEIFKKLSKFQGNTGVACDLDNNQHKSN